MSQRVQKSLLGVFLRSFLELYVRELLQWSASGSDGLPDTERFRTVLEEIATRAMFRKGLRNSGRVRGQMQRCHSQHSVYLLLLRQEANLGGDLPKVPKMYIENYRGLSQDPKASYKGNSGGQLVTQDRPAQGLPGIEREEQRWLWPLAGSGISSLGHHGLRAVVLTLVNSKSLYICFCLI